MSLGISLRFDGLFIFITYYSFHWLSPIITFKVFLGCKTFLTELRKKILSQNQEFSFIFYYWWQIDLISFPENGLSWATDSPISYPASLWGLELTKKKKILVKIWLMANVLQSWVLSEQLSPYWAYLGHVSIHFHDLLHVGTSTESEGPSFWATKMGRQREARLFQAQSEVGAARREATQQWSGHHYTLLQAFKIHSKAQFFQKGNDLLLLNYSSSRDQNNSCS